MNKKFLLVALSCLLVTASVPGTVVEAAESLDTIEALLSFTQLERDESDRSVFKYIDESDYPENWSLIYVEDNEFVKFYESAVADCFIDAFGVDGLSGEGGFTYDLDENEIRIYFAPDMVEGLSIVNYSIDDDEFTVMVDGERYEMSVELEEFIRQYRLLKIMLLDIRDWEFMLEDKGITLEQLLNIEYEQLEDLWEFKMSGEINADISENAWGLSYDFGEDVEKGLLYSNEEGRITDSDGNVIPEYEAITVLENGALMENDIIYESYFAGAGGKIIQDIPEAVDYETDYGVFDELMYYEENINDTVVTSYNDDGTVTTYMDSDGNYFDEVVSGAWFGEDGIPLAMFPPQELWTTGVTWSLYEPDYGTIRYQHFDDALDIDTLKKSDTDIYNTYSMLLKNVQKYNDGDETYIEGTEFYSNEQVILHGEFKTELLDGDNVLAFASYTGLASDDTPNFYACYVEVENGRF